MSFPPPPVYGRYLEGAFSMDNKELLAALKVCFANKTHKKLASLLNISTPSLYVEYLEGRFIVPPSALDKFIASEIAKEMDSLAQENSSFDSLNARLLKRYKEARRPKLLVYFELGGWGTLGAQFYLFAYYALGISLVFENIYPKMVIHSVFSSQYLRFAAPRFCISGENTLPNLNIDDLSMGPYIVDIKGDSQNLFHNAPVSLDKNAKDKGGDTDNDAKAKMSDNTNAALPRHLLAPLFHFSMLRYSDYLDNRRGKRSKEVCEKILASKTTFASFCVSSDRGESLRSTFFRELSHYKVVESGGSVLNNLGGPVQDKDAFIKKSKFNICFENSVGVGYLTEKLYDAFVSDTIPIYLGDPLVCETFNKDSFILVKDESDFKRAIEEIKYLDNNDSAYCAKLATPIFVNREEIDVTQLNIARQLARAFGKDPFMPDIFTSKVRLVDFIVRRTRFIIDEMPKKKSYAERLICLAKRVYRKVFRP